MSDKAQRGRESIVEWLKNHDGALNGHTDWLVAIDETNEAHRVATNVMRLRLEEMGERLAEMEKRLAEMDARVGKLPSDDDEECTPF